MRPRKRWPTTSAHSGVRTILDFGFTKFIPLAEAKVVHDYGFETQRAHPDVILGHWIHIDPHTGAEGVRELRRCIDHAPGIRRVRRLRLGQRTCERSGVEAVLRAVHRSGRSRC